MSGENKKQIAVVIQWFEERGFGVQFEACENAQGERLYWAALTRLPSGRVVAPMYGEGDTHSSAALMARERFEREHSRGLLPGVLHRIVGGSRD